MLTAENETRNENVGIRGEIDGNGFIYVDDEGIVHIENICNRKYCANGDEDNIEITENPTGEIPSVGKDTPMITLNGNSTIYVGIGGEYIEEGAKARTIGGETLEYTTEIKLKNEVVERIDTSVENEYTITYSTTNKEETVSVTRKVIIVEMKPVITMTEPNENYVKEQEVLITVSAIKPNKVEKFNVEIKKNGESISTEEVTGLSKTLSFTETGSYEVIVTATDNNNHTNTLSKTYRISNSVPVITVEPKEVTLKTSEVIGYNLKIGITARDEIDGDITNKIEVIGGLSATEGTYTITYKVTNSVGNSATETRTIIVEKGNQITIDTPGIEALDPDGNLRYTGGNPNNYVEFGNDMYRIIGVFNNQMKIIYWGSKTNVGQFYGNTGIQFDPAVSQGGHGEQGSSDWTQAKLQTTLNTEYWNTINGTYQAMVEQDHVWNIGANVAYDSREGYYVRENTNKWTGKVGLMTPADYGYATNGINCSNSNMQSWRVNSGEFVSCASPKNNWLANTSYQQWFITNYAIQNGVHYVAMTGGVSFAAAFNGFRVRPTLYLKPNINIKSGEGTEESPYVLENPISATELVTNNSDITTLDPDGNPRFVGGNPKNYVEFGNDMYRIIGVFNGQMKIIKNDFYSIDKAYDTSGGTNGNSNWARPADINTELNTTYWNTIDSIYQEMVIQNYSWGIEGVVSGYTRRDFYNAEHVNTWNGKVGLMSPADFGYASRYTYCTDSTDIYTSAECGNVNWIVKSSYRQWTMIRYQSDNVFSIFPPSSFVASAVGLSSPKNTGEGIRPCLYLKPEVKITNATEANAGTIDNPYKLSL